MSGHRACNAVSDNNACGETYTGNYSEFLPQSCSGYAPQYATSDLVGLTFDNLGNALLGLLEIVGAVVVVLLTLYLFGRVEKGIKGENK